MKFLKEQFKNAETAKNFWDNSAFDILDINFALSDLGLKAEALTFSIHFAEPDILNILSAFRFDFAFLKKILGIPQQYVSREVKFSPDMEEPSRDSSVLKHGAVNAIKRNFDKAINMIRKEIEQSLKKFSVKGERLLKSGAITKSQVAKFKPKFEVIDETMNEIEKQIKKTEKK